MDKALLRAQQHAFSCGIRDGRRNRLDGWANHSPSYRAGQVMARIESDLCATIGGERA